MADQGLQIIKLIDYSTKFGPRVLGIEIKEKVLGILKKYPTTVIVFDFKEVEYISTGFSKELFGELWRILGNDFKSHIKFKFYDNKEIIISSIIKGIESIDKS